MGDYVFTFLQYWDMISSNPMEGIGDTFAAIPNGKEIRELQHSIRTFLRDNKVCQ